MDGLPVRLELAKKSYREIHRNFPGLTSWAILYLNTEAPPLRTSGWRSLSHGLLDRRRPGPFLLFHTSQVTEKESGLKETVPYLFL